jgi:hypothetical protein
MLGFMKQVGINRGQAWNEEDPWIDDHKFSAKKVVLCRSIPGVQENIPPIFEVFWGFFPQPQPSAWQVDQGKRVDRGLQSLNCGCNGLCATLSFLL